MKASWTRLVEVPFVINELFYPIWAYWACFAPDSSPQLGIHFFLFLSLHTVRDAPPWETWLRTLHWWRKVGRERAKRWRKKPSTPQRVSNPRPPATNRRGDFFHEYSVEFNLQTLQHLMKAFTWEMKNALSSCITRERSSPYSIKKEPRSDFTCHSDLMKLRLIHYVQNNFLLYFALEVTGNCICEIHRLALNGVHLNTDH